MPGRYPLLVFDWDGTLIDSAGAIVACIQDACRDLGVCVPDAARASHVIGLGLQDALTYAVPGLAESDYGRMVERYRHHFLTRNADIPLFAGTEQMLAELHGRGHHLAIATGKSHAGLARSLESTGLRRYFTGSSCADQCPSKPAPDMLHELMQEYGVEADETLMVGDTVHDLRMAANAGVDAVAVSHGAHPKLELLALQPLACLDNTKALHQWLSTNA